MAISKKKKTSASNKKAVMPNGVTYKETGKKVLRYLKNYKALFSLSLILAMVILLKIRLVVPKAMSCLKQTVSYYILFTATFILLIMPRPAQLISRRTSIRCSLRAIHNNRV